MKRKKRASTPTPAAAAPTAGSSRIPFLIILALALLLLFARPILASRDSPLRRVERVMPYTRNLPNSRWFRGPCDSLEPGWRPICYRIRNMHLNHGPPMPMPPPPPRNEEIDPRYGVQKRLVPSGPNPLHN